MAENSKGRGANFTIPELNQLVASWLHVSQDPIVGSGQKLGAFWDRTLKHYNDNKPPERERRNVRSLETKWSDLKRDVATFAGCSQVVVDANISGTSLEDSIKKSKELYVVKDPKGRSFMYIDQWLLLKDCPRFAMTIDDMHQKAAQKKARKQKGRGRNAIATDKENETPNVEGVVDLDENDEVVPDGQWVASNDTSESLHFGEQRPIGNKIAKKQKAEEMSSSKTMATAQREMAAISAKRLKLAERQDMDRFLTLRVADLDPECQDYFRACRAKELRIAMLKLQREEEEEMRQLRGAIQTPLPSIPTIHASALHIATSNVAECSPIDDGVSPGVSHPVDDSLAELDRELASP